uniref:SH3 domain-containing protein n=1 Tax=Anopheles farauti TaxID=69004 RepID=A0A182QR43_9DIPT
HIPKAKATTIAETPEFKRIAENTKIQSNVKYHADFEKLKGKVTQVADDPETLRIKQNTKNISNVAYHGDLQKKAAMERQRECTEIIDSKDNNDLESEYFSEQLAAESLPHYQPPPPPPVVAPAGPPSQQVNNNVVEVPIKAFRNQLTSPSTHLHGPVFASEGVTANNNRRIGSRVYRALYDYEAQDSDEVGFSEGDLIIEVNSIDAGWMTGRVERTGLTGMLPANYVEQVKI